MVATREVAIAKGYAAILSLKKNIRSNKSTIFTTITIAKISRCVFTKPLTQPIVSSFLIISSMLQVLHDNPERRISGDGRPSSSPLLPLRSSRSSLQFVSLTSHPCLFLLQGQISPPVVKLSLVSLDKWWHHSFQPVGYLASVSTTHRKMRWKIRIANNWPGGQSSRIFPVVPRGHRSSHFSDYHPVTRLPSPWYHPWGC